MRTDDDSGVWFLSNTFRNEIHLLPCCLDYLHHFSTEHLSGHLLGKVVLIITV